MQGKVIIVCGVCKKQLGEVDFDTAKDTNPGLYSEAERVLLAHREECIHYGSGMGQSFQPISPR